MQIPDMSMTWNSNLFQGDTHMVPMQGLRSHTFDITRQRCRQGLKVSSPWQQGCRRCRWHKQVHIKSFYHMICCKTHRGSRTRFPFSVFCVQLTACSQQHQEETTIPTRSRCAFKANPTRPNPPANCLKYSFGRPMCLSLAD